MSRSPSCPICMAPYDDKGNYPVVLLCGHSFCASCSKSYHNNSGNCPICRTAFRFPNGFTKSFALLECIGNHEENYNPADRKQRVDRARKSGISYISDQMEIIKDLTDRVSSMEDENNAMKQEINYLKEQNKKMDHKLRAYEVHWNMQHKHSAKEFEVLKIEQKRYEQVNRQLKDDMQQLTNSIIKLTKQQDVLQKYLGNQQIIAASLLPVYQEIQETNTGVQRLAPTQQRKPRTLIGHWQLISYNDSGHEKSIDACAVHAFSFKRMEANGITWNKYRRNGSCLDTFFVEMDTITEKENNCRFQLGDDIFFIEDDGETLTQTWKQRTFTYKRTV